MINYVFLYFYRSLSNENKKKVIALCDVDEKKIARGKFDVYDDQLRQVTFSIPIINYRYLIYYVNIN